MWAWYVNIARTYITSHSCGDFASRDVLYPLSTFLSASGLHTAVVRRSLDDHASVHVPRAPSFELSDELDNAYAMIAVLLPVGGNRTHVRLPKDILTTIALYRSAITVLIEFNIYFDSRVV